MARMTASEPELLKERYRLEEVVGEGGMAVVWRALDTVLGRQVALKILRDQFASDPEFLARFRSEARAAAALNDPGVVSVHDVGEDNGRHFLVMEYVPGCDLKAVIRDEAPLSPDRAVKIAARLSRAVSAAHEIDLVHRDVKPQNVLVSPDGRMKVADFGIARAVAAAGMTAPGLVMGTVHYIAPEQAAGKAATPASDVYSLGVVLYEMLTGSVPFDADSSLGVAMKIMNEDPEPVEQRNPRVPTVLAGIVGRAMARRPEDRYPDAGALAVALDNFASWSEQVTGGLRVPDTGAAAFGAAERRSAVAPGPVAVRSPAEAAAAAGGPAAHGGPMLDSTGLILALIALLALAGLIPLWLAVLARAELPTAGRGAGAGGGSNNSIVSPTATTAKPEAMDLLPAAPVEVPNVTRLAVDDARQRLERAQFGVTVSSEETDATPPGQVMRQVPAGGDSVEPGMVVNLVVSRPPSVEVPVLGGDYQTVHDALLGLGFQPLRDAVWSGAGSGVDMVIGLEPPPGSRLPAGSPIHIVVNSGSWLTMGVDFEDNLHLRAVDLPRDTISPGDVLTLVAHWEAVAPIEGEYVARAVLATESGELVSKAEHAPGDRPTQTWQPGERFTGGRFDLPVDSTVVPGEFELWLEVVAPGDPERRLPVRSRGFARSVVGNQVLVMAIQVTSE